MHLHANIELYVHPTCEEHIGSAAAPNPFGVQQRNPRHALSAAAAATAAAAAVAAAAGTVAVAVADVAGPFCCYLWC